MIAEYRKKSVSKRRKIFEQRTRKLSTLLIQRFASSQAKFITKGTAAKAGKQISDEILRAILKQGVAEVLMDESEISHGELVKYVEKAIGTSAEKEAVPSI